MNKIQEDWVMVEESDFSSFENKSHKTMLNEVKITSTGWTVINYPEIWASDVNAYKKMSNKNKEQRENAGSQTTGPSGPMWFDISLSD